MSHHPYELSPRRFAYRPAGELSRHGQDSAPTADGSARYVALAVPGRHYDDAPLVPLGAS
ncbi:hypothetical protein OG760_32680 [Streptomyces sp. NBC_00963]|uniref:hypothetical protein n=1 Tax=Streptomyces sp. NBC_00963 TaxID=2903697 RepID=UPI0038673DAC|nr:hypothetical protein OG760_32680 [Streptomyces sp. NBC_00963]